MTRFGALVERVDKRIPGSGLPLLSVSQTLGVIRRSELTASPPRAESLDHYKTCHAGDVVFNKMSIRAGAMGVAQEPGLVTYHYEVMRPRAGVDPRYVVYLMKSDAFAAEMIRRERGIAAGDDSGAVRTTEVPFRVLRTIDAYVPEPTEQRAIADYLDRETTRIDEFIAQNEELIALLAERRSASITSAVVGAVGVGSRVALRHLTSVLDCKHVTAEPSEGDGSFAVASVREVAGRWVSVDGARRTTADSFSRLGEGGRTLRAWDLLVCRNTSVGKVSIVPPNIEPTVMGQDVSLIRTPDSNPDIARFMYYALTSAIGVDGFEKAAIGSTFKRINVDDIKALRVPKVDPDVARDVADQLDAMTLQIDEAILTAQHSMELARQRRAALISAAVTGKIDVRVAA